MARVPRENLTSSSPAPVAAAPAAAVGTWKDNPVVVGGIGVVVTATLLIALFTQVVIPDRVDDAANKAKKLEEAQRSLTAAVATKDAELAAAKDVNKALQANADAVRHDLQIASHKFLVAGNPYPVGLGIVRVGEPAARVKQAYPTATLDEREQRYLLSRSHPIFERVSFYFNPDSGDKTITRIVFEIPDHVQFDSRFLREKVRDALGL